MKVNDRWEITGTKHDFVVTETRTSLGKDSKEKQSQKNTFHASLDQCMAKIIAREIQDGLDVADLAEFRAYMGAVTEKLQQDLRALAPLVSAPDAP